MRVSFLLLGIVSHVSSQQVVVKAGGVLTIESGGTLNVGATSPSPDVSKASPPPSAAPTPPPQCRGICAYVDTWSTSYPGDTFDIGTISVTLQEQWWISFEVRMTGLIGAEWDMTHHQLTDTVDSEGVSTRLPGVFVDADGGFYGSWEPGAPSNTPKLPKWNSDAIQNAASIHIEFKRTLQSDGTYTSEYLVDGVVVDSGNGEAAGISGQVQTFYGRRVHQWPPMDVRNFDIWYYE